MGIPPRAVIWPNFNIHPIEKERGPTTGYSATGASNYKLLSESLSNVVFLIDILMPPGMPPHVAEVLNDEQRNLAAHWFADPIYRQCSFSFLTQHGSVAPKQLNTVYPDVLRLKRHWAIPLADCKRIVPDPLQVVHHKHWNIARMNFINIVAGQDFIYPTGPHTPEKRTFDGQVARVISDPRLRYLPELALRPGDAIENDTRRDLKDVSSHAAPQRKVQLGKFKPLCPTLTRGGDQRVSLQTSDPMVD